MSRAGRRSGRRDGFSLLEVILALAILTGAVAALGEVARLGLWNARVARDMARAQLLCESKLAEITSGITTADPVSRAVYQFTNANGTTTNVSGTTANISGDDEVQWLYSVEVTYIDVEGLAAVCVTVEQDLPAEKRPVKVNIARWIPDPGLELTEGSTSEDTTAESSESEGG